MSKLLLKKEPNYCEQHHTSVSRFVPQSYHNKIESKKDREKGVSYNEREREREREREGAEQDDQFSKYGPTPASFFFEVNFHRTCDQISFFLTHVLTKEAQIFRNFLATSKNTF